MAVQFALVDAGDWRAVMALIACSSGKAKELTKSTRDVRDSERRRRMYDLRKQGWSHARIGSEVGLTEEAVRQFIKSLGEGNDPHPDRTRTRRSSPA